MVYLPVNATTQWGTLRQILLGKADNACYQPIYQPCQKPKIYDPYLAEHITWPEGRKTQKRIDLANKELDNFERILKENDIVVHRPETVDWSGPIKSPWWEVKTQYCSVCPRDTLITVGNVILEASMSRRDRYFEVFAYRQLLEDLWKADRRCLWKSGPRSSMRDRMYNPEWLEIDDAEKQRRIRRGGASYCLQPDREVVFDAADFTRTGKHVFGQISKCTNVQGVEWVRRELEPHGFQVHPIRFSDSDPVHIDCTLVPLRPGLVLTNPVRSINEYNREMWSENDWEFIEAPMPVNQKVPAFSQSSIWLNMNVLGLSEDTVVAEAQETSMHALLEDYGFQVIKIPFRNVFEFGGGIHCSTWDITRDDSPVDLFKKWMPHTEPHMPSED